MSDVQVHGVLTAADAVALPEGARLIRHRELAAVVSDAPAGQQLAARALREHWRVLEAVAAGTTVLPVRFGTAMAGEQAVIEQYLEPEHDVLAARLADLAGTVQLTVKGSYESETMLREVVERSPAIKRLSDDVARMPQAAAYAKRIHLGELVAAEVQRERDRDSALVRERLEPLARAVRMEPVRGEDAGVNAAFLVDRAGIDAFSQAVTALGAELGDRMRLRYLGPLPPYSFTEPEVAAWA